MRKNVIWALLVAALIAGVPVPGAQAAAPPIEWQSAISATGTGSESPRSNRATSDGGYIITGTFYKQAPDNSIPAYGNYDCFVARTDAQGGLLWKKTFGGSDGDNGYDALELPDGGFLVGASTYGPVSGNREVAAEWGGIWLIRLDAAGEKLWEKVLSDNFSTDLKAMDRVGDGFVLAATTWGGPGGDKTSESFGGSDCWVVRIDGEGRVLWDTTHGGPAYEVPQSIQATADGGCIVTCISDSEPGGSKTSPYYGELDYWVIRLNAQGDKIWERSFGGTSGDIPTCGIQTRDGGFLVGGQSGSEPDGNKTSPHHGSSDFWFVRLNPDGEVLWQTSLGGSGFEHVVGAIQTWEGGFLIAGGSSSPPGTGNKTSPQYAQQDVWLVRWDEAGNELWQETLGGDAYDESSCVLQAADGAYVVACGSGSTISGNKTVADRGYWLVKLRPDTVNLRVPEQSLSSLQEVGMQLLLSAPPSNAYPIEVSSNLGTWAPWRTNYMTSNAAILLDESVSGVGQRFYRVRPTDPQR